MSLLEVRGLEKSFGGLKAVDQVGFAVTAGRMVALIGPNGAGKSTCFNMVGGQLAPDAGSVRLDGVELVGRRPGAIFRLGVGRTFQIAAVFPSMTVRENVQTALMSRDRRILSPLARGDRFGREAALRLLSRVGIAEQAERPCGNLAYGDVKRVELAIALANDPRLLLMDEPTAGMAPRERVALMALVAEIVRERGLGVLFTEHDMDIVFGSADTVLVMHQGRLIAAGPPAEMREDPAVRAIYLGDWRSKGFPRPADGV